MPLNFEGTNISPDMQNSLKRYINRGIAPGSYVAAIIANDLLTAVARAEDLTELRELAFFVANNFEADAHGSYLKMNDYMKRVQREAESHGFF